MNRTRDETGFAGWVTQSQYPTTSVGAPRRSRADSELWVSDATDSSSPVAVTPDLPSHPVGD